MTDASVFGPKIPSGESWLSSKRFKLSCRHFTPGPLEVSFNRLVKIEQWSVVHGGVKIEGAVLGEF
jgi:hypothetical protein